MNEYDSDRMAGILTLGGHTIVGDEKSADTVIVNTCSVRQLAEEKAFSYIGQYTRKKKVIIAGCMAESMKERLMKKFPNCYAIAGTYNFSNISEIIKGGKRKVYTGEAVEKYPSKLKRAKPVSGFVTIMQGCDNYCSYCIVPYVRGRERSRDAAGILKELETMALDGYREVTLLGQNVNSFHDNASNMNFAGLLKAASELSGLERLKFMTSHPKDLSEELIKTVSSLPMAAKHFHLPVQAGSDAVLEMMSRRYTRRKYLSQIDAIRSVIPDASITTDILVGFPGETDADFEQTVDLVRKARFDSSYVFKYSVRTGTVAEKMDDNVTPAEKTRRINYMLELQKKISEDINYAMLGGTYEMLGLNQGRRNAVEIEGTLDSGKKVYVAAGADMIGKKFNVKLLALKGLGFKGEIVK
jgi:tRNA-2-methylthio-N6-dimethylallyladenosine synthase